jgi:hypothetical protein
MLAKLCAGVAALPVEEQPSLLAAIKSWQDKMMCCFLLPFVSQVPLPSAT